MQHHAYLYVTQNSASLVLPEVYKRASEDVTYLHVDMFGIDDARLLTTQSTQRPVKEMKRTFVISTNTITSEAQNALLKLFEEPPETAEFHLIVTKRGLLLPTLVSRLYEIENIEDVSISTSELFSSFQAASYGERIAMIAELAKSKKTEEMESIMHAAELSVHGSKNPSILKNISFVSNYFAARGSSSKMLLEVVALSLPKA